MDLTALIVISVLHITEITGSSQSSALIYRHQNFHTNYGNFKPKLNHYLSAKVISTSSVVDMFDCIFKCVEETSCYSLNVASNPDSNGLHLCELLDTDKYELRTVLEENDSFHHYSPLFPCDKSNPCQNNGACVYNSDKQEYYCDCQPGFAGTFCERTGKTCSDIKTHSSQAVTGSYDIDPDGEGGYEPFTVHCDMEYMNGAGVTVVSHDSEARTLVNGFEGKGTYSRDVTYIASGLTTIEQLVLLITESASCEQFIKYECVNNPILYNGNKYGWWVSRNNEAMNYWGGATPADVYKCACGLTNSCADPSDGCNCDIDDGALREDSGLLTEKSDLPVLQLRFGDTGASVEWGYHTLGKFKCYGMINCENSNPCQNNGACVYNSDKQEYYCDCQAGFAGTFCERTGKTCSDIKTHSSQAVTGSYDIDPDGEGGYEPFTVHCDMEYRNGAGVTVISHDSEARTLVDGFEASGSYSHNVSYTASGLTGIEQLIALITASANCEQFIKYECLNNGILYNGNKVGWWVSRNYEAMNYWGGATPADVYKCACGLTNSCADPSDGCNCDINDSTWREDSGLLTEKSDLPVLQLKFGDTGSSGEQGYHTLGKFKCYGNA